MGGDVGGYVVEALGFGVLGGGLRGSRSVYIRCSDGGGWKADFDFAEGGLELANTAGDNYNACTFGRELLGDAESHSFGTASDENGLEKERVDSG